MPELSDTIYTVTVDGQPFASHTTMDAAVRDVETKYRQSKDGTFDWGPLDITTSPVTD